MSRLVNLLFLLSFFICFGQIPKVEEDILLYEKAQLLREIIHTEELFDLIHNPKNEAEENARDKLILTINKKSLEIYTEIVKDYPDSYYYVVALYEKGFYENILGDKKNAKSTFEKLIQLNSNNWKHYLNKSLVDLAMIEIENGNYKIALQYLDKRTENGFSNLCGIEYDTVTTEVKNYYKLCYDGLGIDKN